MKMPPIAIAMRTPMIMTMHPNVCLIPSLSFVSLSKSPIFAANTIAQTIIAAISSHQYENVIEIIFLGYKYYSFLLYSKMSFNAFLALSKALINTSMDCVS